jgi:nucleoside-diphosphate-sugar epimerase
MRVLVTGGTGVLGRASLPLLRAAGHDVASPGRTELDLLDAAAVARAVDGADAVLHLATRIPTVERMQEPDAWRANDRLRRDASKLLVDAALAAETALYVQPTVTFVYPQEGPADEETPPAADGRSFLRSALDAEAAAARFAAAGRRAVVLRFGYLDGPDTGNPSPNPRFGATLDTRDAGTALAAALAAPGGLYNVCRDGERVANVRFVRETGWRPEH